MIGVFDSGAGGSFATRALRSIRPNVDIAFLADRENAPYGTKSEGELVRLVSRDIERLMDTGCERVLMACCTASAIHGRLPRELREVALPIIAPVSREAVALTRKRKIGIISTEATMRGEAFPREILRMMPDAETVSCSSRELVTLADSGACDGSLTEYDKEIIIKEIYPFFDSGIDVLILGCTHFASFEREIERLLGVRTVNSARVGAIAIAEGLPDEGSGQTVYL